MRVSRYVDALIGRGFARIMNAEEVLERRREVAREMGCTELKPMRPCFIYSKENDITTARDDCGCLWVKFCKEDLSDDGFLDFSPSLVLPGKRSLN